MLHYLEFPISEASSEILAKATEIVNLANSAYDRIFPGDRLRPSSIVDEFLDGTIILAISDSVSVGTVTISGEEGGIKISLLAVLKSASGQNIGASLLDYASQLAKQRGHGSIWLEVVDRGPLVDYYRRLGFTEDFRTLMPIGKWGATETFDLVTMSRPC